MKIQKFMTKKNRNDYKILSSPIYTIAEASRLVNISRGRISRWLRGYSYPGGIQGPVITRKISNESTYASFLDLIDLLFVKRFINKGFTLQYVRKALEDARKYLGTPHFARNKFFTNSQQIILDLPDSSGLVVLLTDGQRAMNEIIENVYDKVDFEEATEFGFAQRWYPTPEGKQGLIVIDPRISFGRPSIMGRGVATENVFDLFLGENKKVEPVSNWFNLPKHEIRAAVQFETALAG